ncbi:MAG TPA: hypothetical protein VFV38_04500, partial [Ktedonobacteraceae bacterium]|nr:hypothetical protein [Ktedonobacteraceae bacterium]
MGFPTVSEVVLNNSGDVARSKRRPAWTDNYTRKASPAGSNAFGRACQVAASLHSFIAEHEKCGRTNNRYGVEIFGCRHGFRPVGESLSTVLNKAAFPVPSSPFFPERLRVGVKPLWYISTSSAVFPRLPIEGEPGP